MKCLKCGLDLEQGARFCGNCGTAVGLPVTTVAGIPVTTPSVTPPSAAIPSLSAIAPAAVIAAVIIPENVPVRGKKVIIGRICAITSLVPGLIYPLLGLTLGIAGLILNIGQIKKSSRTSAVVYSVASLLGIALGLWGVYYNIRHRSAQ